jgi:hypothetical protein
VELLPWLASVNSCAVIGDQIAVGVVVEIVEQGVGDLADTSPLAYLLDKVIHPLGLAGIDQQVGKRITPTSEQSQRRGKFDIPSANATGRQYPHSSARPCRSITDEASGERADTLSNIRAKSYPIAQ